MTRPRRSSAKRAAAGVVLVALLSALSPLEATSPPNPYLEDLSALFAELDANYPFFEVKGIEKEWQARKKLLAKRAQLCRSDEEFGAVILDVLRGLRDGHCRLEAMRVSPPQKTVAWPGVALLPGPKGTALVMETGGNLKSALPPGTIVTRIDGKPAAKAMELRTQKAWQEGGFFSSQQRARFFEYRQAFSGDRGSTTEIRYLDGRKQKKLTLIANQELKGWAHNYHLPDGSVTAGKSVYHASLDGGVGYLYLRRMDESVEPGIRAALTAYPEATGWIIDLRGNTGGGYEKSLGSLCEGFRKKVAVIIDAGAISAAETFARDLAEDQSARLFGSTTAGSSSTKKVYELPSGFAKIRYSVGTRRGLKGKSIEFHGIAPDVEVSADPRDLREGRNTEIEAAKQWLSGKS